MDDAYIHMLRQKADKFRQKEKSSLRAKNYDACGAYIKLHGVPYEDPKSAERLVLYAVNGTAHVVKERDFNTLVSLKPKKGPLYDSRQSLCIVVGNFIW